MWIRASIAGFLLLAVLAGAGDSIGCSTRIGESLDAYRRSYRALDGEGVRLNSLDRLVLAVVLAETEPSRPQ